MALIDPAIKASFEKVATSNQWESKSDVWFDFRYGQDMGLGAKTGQLFHTLKCSSGQATVHRADFLDELVKLVPSNLAHFGKRLVAVEDKGHDGIHLKFRDGTEATHAAVVGCDEVKSETRKYVLGHGNPNSYAKFSGKYCHRGLVPMKTAARLLGDKLARNNNVYLGNHGHILTFPVQKGRTMNVVAFSSRQIWDLPDWVVPTNKAEMLADYESWGETVHKLLGLVEKADIWALFDQPSADTFYKGRVCVIGDAAHASTPHQGSGAGMAIEDSYVLSNLLGQVEDPKDVELAFQAFDAVRRERTLKSVNTSREASHLWEFELEGVEDDISKVIENIDRRMQWIWDEDLEAEVEEGWKIMKAESLKGNTSFAQR